MLATVPADREEITVTRADPEILRDGEAFYSPERSSYASSRSNRLSAFLGTALIYVVAGALLLLTFETTSGPARPTASLVVSMTPLPSSPRAPKKPEETRRPVDRHEHKPAPSRGEPVVQPVVPLPQIIAPPPPPAVKMPDPAPAQARATAPATAPAPPVRQTSGNAPDSWEGRVLARLQKYQRYPGAARSAHQQGVAYIRFRISREGHVLSSSMVRSSGYPDLDQAALETIRRADPLPAIPPERPEEIELVVPVEYYLR